MRLPSARTARRALLGAFVAAVAAAIAACVSPTLPLPPPDVPDQIGPSSAQPGQWEIRGGCNPGAVVLVKNMRTSEIVGTEDRDHDGRYLVRIDADACDVAKVWEIVSTTVTDATYFTIEPVVNGTPSSDECDGP